MIIGSILVVRALNYQTLDLMFFKGSQCSIISIQVCLDAWRKVYEVSEYAVKMAVSRLKKGQVANDPAFSDKTQVNMTMQELKKISKKCVTSPFAVI